MLVYMVIAATVCFISYIILCGVVVICTRSTKGLKDVSRAVKCMLPTLATIR